MLADAQLVWAECLQSVARRISGPAVQTWLEPLKPVALMQQEGRYELVLESPSPFSREWLMEHYTSLLQNAALRVLNHPTQVTFTAAGGGTDLPEWGDGTREREPYFPALKEAAGEVRGPLLGPLNPQYSFDTFIEGDSNRLARSAAWSIAERPGKTSFNPFLVYGGVGLGKTHLVQAIAAYVRQNHTGLQVGYVSSEQFTTEFLRSVQLNRVAEFSLFYRHFDVLIVDDIQFFGGKEKTQEEFFHLFNALHQSGKQIVLCADRPPREIAGVQERLLSRFQWGLSTSIEPPDYDTRKAIVRHKARTNGFTLPGDVEDFLAQRVTANVRELEGAILRLVAQTTLQQKNIDLATAHFVLKDLIGALPAHLDIEDIQRTVAEFYRLPMQELLSRNRKREIVSARQVAMFLCKQHTTHTLQHIGRRFGGRDHTTVIHACTAVQDRIDVETGFRREMERLQHVIAPQAA